MGGERSLNVVPSAEFYYDIANDEVYYQLKGILRLKLAGSSAIDFTYEKGSGAPNFNEGDQFGVGLTFAF